MKIYLYNDYNGKLTNNIFLSAGEQTVTVDIGLRMIEHGLAGAVIEDDQTPIAQPVSIDVKTKKRKRG